MHRFYRKTILLAAASLLCATRTAPLRAQAQPASHGLHITETTAAVLVNFERAQIAQTGTPSFWLKGGAAEATITFRHGFGLAANLTGEHAANIATSVSLGKIAFLAGPRYTFNTSALTRPIAGNRRTAVFGEALFGGAHAFDSTFPSGSSGVQSTANAFSMQAGGGVDVAFRRHIGIRPIELDLVHTTLPNNASNAQNDLRVAFGASFRFAGR